MLQKRHNLIICCGMSRSASTLQYQIVKALLPEWKACGHPLGWKGEKNAIIKSEPYRTELGELLNAGTALGISIYRDPRSVAVSLRNFYSTRSKLTDHYPVPWPVILEKLDEAIEWHHSWSLHPGVVNFRYEQYLPDDLTTFIDTTATLLGVKGRDIDAIADNLQISQQIKRTTRQEKWFDFDTLLTQGHISYNNGQECWKEMLSVREAFGVQNLARARFYLRQKSYPTLTLRGRHE